MQIAKLSGTVKYMIKMTICWWQLKKGNKREVRVTLTKDAELKLGPHEIISY